jgi:thiol-disulfide isomerase/thioredoxin
LILDQIARGFPKTSGVPDQFFPVFGDQLEPLLSINRLAIVYAWRESCPPCDEMRATLEEYFADEETEIARFAIFGPDWGEMLYDEYDAAVAPTTLFFCDGRLDVRMIGPKSRSRLGQEIEILKEQL